MAQPPLTGPAHAARDRSRGARPADADQGLRFVGATQESHPATDRSERGKAAASAASGTVGQKEEQMKLTRVALVALTLCVHSVAALAQTGYPSRPVRMIVPFAPGGASDFVARIISPRLSELLGQSIVIENKQGASGNIGMEAAARAPADGYTIYLGNIGTIAINPTVFPNLSVNPLKDFIAVTEVADVPSILIANPGVPVNSVAELVTLAKAKPGELNFASPGSSTLNRLEMEHFMKLADIKLVHIPYKGGAGPAVTGMLS